MDIPSSSPEGKDWINHQLLQLKQYGINRVIDIGCGAATYYNYFQGILECKWTGVEIWEPYITEYKLLDFYENIIVQNAADVDYESLGKFDVAFVGDVLEHMTKEEAVITIEKLQKVCRFIFISIPIVYYPSEEYDFNPYLRHIKPDWSDKEVNESFIHIKDKNLGNVVGTYLLTEEDIRVKKKEFYFLIGLPRSGSTLLAALLRQNDNVYVSSTSPMLDQLVANQNIYKHKLQSTKANYNQVQLDNITLRMIDGMWSHVSQDKIIDNNRGWGKNLKAAEILFKKKIKCIALYRDIPSIMASWLMLIRKNPENTIDIDLKNRNLEVTDYNRMMLLWHEMVLDCVEALCCAVEDCPEDVLLVNYDDLVENPEIELNKINTMIGSNLEYKFDGIDHYSIKQKDRSAWGLSGMHQIRSKLEKVNKDPKGILGDELFVIFSELDKQFIARILGENNAC